MPTSTQNAKLILKDWISLSIKTAEATIRPKKNPQSLYSWFSSRKTITCASKITEVKIPNKRVIKKFPLSSIQNFLYPDAKKDLNKSKFIFLIVVISS